MPSTVLREMGPFELTHGSFLIQSFVGNPHTKESHLTRFKSDPPCQVSEAMKASPSQEGQARSKRDFPYNYEAEAYNSITPADSGYHTPAADDRQGQGTDIVFQFPQTTVPELIVNLAPVSLFLLNDTHCCAEGSRCLQRADLL